VDFSLEPRNLIVEVAKIFAGTIGCVARSCPRFECAVRSLGQLADFPAQLGRTRPTAFLLRILL
jgi:hypothetical protein